MKIQDVLFLIVGTLILTGCGGGKLQRGGAYAPGTVVITTDAAGVVTTNFVATAAPDAAFFAADATYDLVYASIDAAFKFEKDNRLLLWKITPDIKHGLDLIRPQAVGVNLAWAKARQAYIANPTPAHLSQLQTILTQLQSLAEAARAAVQKGL